MTTDRTYAILSNITYRMTLDVLNDDDVERDEAINLLCSRLPEERSDVLPNGTLVIDDMTIEEVLNEALCLGMVQQRIEDLDNSTILEVRVERA